MVPRVLVGMSGGVDSSVAAALLKEAGYEVIGVTMCFNVPASLGKRPSCCGIQGIEDARRVAHKLGIRHYVLNFARALEEKVIRDFCQEYLRGHTPNPCVRCNQFLKFDILLAKALSLGCSHLATGHYARVIEKEGKYFLKKGRDRKKDQSYFLYRLSQQQLKHVLMPLGSFSKDEVRKLARKFNLPVADKPGSQEICFIPKDDYHEFLARRLSGKIKAGEIVDKEGNILGTHKGICYYTIGQRQGLGIARGYPLYVIKIDGSKNRLVVGEKKDVFKAGCIVRAAHFLGEPLNKTVVLKVKIRYNHKEASARVSNLGRNKFKVIFKTAQPAITPGQSAVFYDKDSVIGGGIIEKVRD
ncbi:MAG: tRNA 2-thiouridine(34) synthase MnmA [Candidatus Omnitrophica bacterium]|nr:tRNA 2-thiouridine(34) synthase MnmA [Candidatus Omnitrophota bacterium]MDD5236132.1 tRNA 2-thiouridine(34) synthase MnmA [Candidatus Omnitrophota bacterium]